MGVSALWTSLPSTFAAKISRGFILNISRKQLFMINLNTFIQHNSKHKVYELNSQSRIRSIWLNSNKGTLKSHRKVPPTPSHLPCDLSWLPASSPTGGSYS